MSGLNSIKETMGKEQWLVQYIVHDIWTCSWQVGRLGMGRELDENGEAGKKLLAARLLSQDFSMSLADPAGRYCVHIRSFVF